MKIRGQKDFWAGLMFMAFGLFFLIWALLNYQMGSAVRMGPAYFPSVLGGLLAVIGLFVLIDSFVEIGPKVARFHFRPLVMILLACLAFAYTLKPFGLVGATALVVFISALGGHEFKFKEVAILYVVLVIFSVLVFVKGLTLPFPIWPAFME